MPNIRLETNIFLVYIDWKMAQLEEPFARLVGPIPSSKFKRLNMGGDLNGERNPFKKWKEFLAKHQL
jgi:hypothetical protein